MQARVQWGQAMLVYISTLAILVSLWVNVCGDFFMGLSLTDLQRGCKVCSTLVTQPDYRYRTHRPAASPARHMPVA